MNDTKKFQEFKAKHPEWSDEQIWTALSIDLETDRVIEEKGSDVNPDDPNILRSILEGAKEWLAEVLPYVFDKVKVIFQNLLENLREWIKEGIRYLIEHINLFFNR